MARPRSDRLPSQRVLRTMPVEALLGLIEERGGSVALRPDGYLRIRTDVPALYWAVCDRAFEVARLLQERGDECLFCRSRWPAPRPLHGDGGRHGRGGGLCRRCGQPVPETWTLCGACLSCNVACVGCGLPVERGYAFCDPCARSAT